MTESSRGITATVGRPPTTTSPPSPKRAIEPTRSGSRRRRIGLRRTDGRRRAGRPPRRRRRYSEFAPRCRRRRTIAAGPEGVSPRPHRWRTGSRATRRRSGVNAPACGRMPRSIAGGTTYPYTVDLQPMTMRAVGVDRNSRESARVPRHASRLRNGGSASRPDQAEASGEGPVRPHDRRPRPRSQRERFESGPWPGAPASASERTTSAPARDVDPAVTEKVAMHGSRRLQRPENRGPPSGQP